MEFDFNFLKNILIKLLLYISIEELIELLYVYLVFIIYR